MSDTKRNVNDDPWAEDNRMSSPIPKQTSISAHIVQSISVNMTFVEMDTLIQMFGRHHDDYSVTERDLLREFIASVESVRFPVS